MLTTIKWSNEQVLKFLELYASERLLWDPSHKDYKNKHKIHIAWKRISHQFKNTPIKELKFKKKSLMATFRPLLKKKRESIRSGADTDEVFQPIWFAFDAMESFLGAVYNEEDTMNTEGETEQTDEMVLLTQYTGENEEYDAEEKNGEIVTNRKAADDTRPKDHAFKKRRLGQAFDAETEQKQGNLEDDCELYGKLLATKLKRYPVQQRQRIMYKIDGLLLDYPPEICTSPSFLSSSPVYLNHSEAPLYSPSPSNSHDSLTSGYSKHSQPPHSDSCHHPRPSRQTNFTTSHSSQPSTEQIFLPGNVKDEPVTMI